MSILDQIIANKIKEVALNKELKPIEELEHSVFFDREVISMKQQLQREVGIIAEIKRSSPSTGMINNKLDVEQLSMSYIQAGASGLSVLTDHKYFGGSDQDLMTARKFNDCPILRKDFIVDEYQLVEAKSIGADCILLIAACLSSQKCSELASFAKSLGLEVLLEVHDRAEIESHINQHVDLVGVNNRNLHDFRTDISTSILLTKYIPDDFVKISESGISKATQINELQQHGFEGFLIGGYFMKQEKPGVACKNLIDDLKNLTI